MIRNIITSFIARAGVALINLCVLLIASKQMGSEVVGQMSILILNIAVVQSVVEIYSGSTLIYFIPKANMIKVYTYGLLWIAMACAGCNLLLFIFKIIDFTLLMHVLLLSMLFSLHAFHLIILLGKEKIKLYNLLAVLQPIGLLFFLFNFVMLKGINSFSAYLDALYYSILIALIFSSLATWLTVKHSKSHGAQYQFKQILSNGFMNQVANLSHTLSNRLNYYLLGAAALVGVYASSTSLVESLWVISASISPLLLTHVANKRDTINQGQLTLLLSKLCFILSLIGVIVLYVLPANFFIYLMGKDFSETKTVMLCLSPGVLCISFSSILSHYFSGQGMQKIQLSANVSGLFVTIISAWFFIDIYGIIGACIAASLSYATQALVLTIVFFKHNRFKAIKLFSLKKDFELLKS
ncbi:MAG: polysaccharide biosynthesis C-terminal domain-containing protein [Bacteroidota bacterium]